MGWRVECAPPLRLQEHLLRFLPEEAGAAWDGRIGAPEVAAILARLVAEGKLETTVTEDRFLFIPIRTLKMRLTESGRRGKRSYEAALMTSARAPDAASKVLEMMPSTTTVVSRSTRSSNRPYC